MAERAHPRGTVDGERPAMTGSNRDEFAKDTKRQIGRRAGWLCSDLECRSFTVGSNLAGDGEINLGIAAHICAAAPGGPRYDSAMTPEQRRSPENGIWLCQRHAKAVDNDPAAYSVERLREWKRLAHRDSWRRAVRGEAPDRGRSGDALPELARAAVREAAATDLATFRRSDLWPTTDVRLTVVLDALDEPVDARGLAAGLATLGDLVLVADPGMGKTAVVLQVAEAALARSESSPLVITLGDWSVGRPGLLESVLQRRAFRGVSDADLRAVVSQGAVILLLDGWNEMDREARRRAKVELGTLRREQPDLRVLVTTRREAVDVPVRGARAELRVLPEGSQLDIARALRGDDGARMVERAWRTEGVRELVGVPLYLTTLLALPEGAPFPSTKEAALRAFVGAGGKDGLRANSLNEATEGLHDRYLEGLAVASLRGGATVMTDGEARRVVTEAARALVAGGQLAGVPSPRQILDALVSHHVLVRLGDPAGFAFQHHQFQEWYASLFAERLMVQAATNAGARARLRSEVLNWRAWEEPVLFACERSGESEESGHRAFGECVVAAFDVDPMLAAEMISRSPKAVWARVRSAVLSRVAGWHAPGNVDRAVGFMLASGRDEFRDEVWPLVTHEERQVRLSALGAGTRLQVSVLGSDLVGRLKAESPEVRRDVLEELADRSGADGLDVVAAVAGTERVPEIRAAAVGALAFEGAVRHCADALRNADHETFDLLAAQGHVGAVGDARVDAELAAAERRVHARERWPYRRVADLVFGQGGADRMSELETAVAELRIDEQERGAVALVDEAGRRFPEATARGVLRRLREGLPLPRRASALLSGGGLAVEDVGLFELALGGGEHNLRAEAAASVLGPEGVGRLIGAVFEAKGDVEAGTVGRAGASTDRRSMLRRRILGTRIESLVAAAEALGLQADNGRLADLAGLIAAHSGLGEGDGFDAEVGASVGKLVRDWGERLLGSRLATREEMASIASMASRSPSPELLPILRDLLKAELASRRQYRKRASATGYARGRATQEAQTSWTLQYRRAFQAISCPETTATMTDYLLDEEFGASAAAVLAEQWRAREEPPREMGWRRWPDLRRVAEKRAAWRAHPDGSSAEGEAIFDVIEQLLGQEPTEARRRTAVALGVAGAALPHGQRRETVDALIDAADEGNSSSLLMSLVLSGQVIDVERVEAGISGVLGTTDDGAYAVREPWQLGAWFRLLPFTNRLSEAVEIVAGLPEGLRGERWLEELLYAFRFTPDEAAEATLFQLAERDQRLYAYKAWNDAVFGLGTLSSARSLVRLVAAGTLGAKGVDEWQLAKRIGGLLERHPLLHQEVYSRLIDTSPPSGVGMLARAVAESPDEEGLWVLMRLEEAGTGRYVDERMIERLVTRRVYDEDVRGSYALVPEAAPELRRKLLGMVTDGGPTDAAARHLTTIDRIRDELGAPEAEPRHPDLGSGRAWPVGAAERL